MAKQLINVGASPNDGTGDTLRDAGVKLNSNITEVYTSLGDNTNILIDVSGADVGDALRWDGSNFIPQSIATDTNTLYDISAEAAVGGAAIRLTGTDSTTEDVTIISGPNVTVSQLDAETIEISSIDTNTTYDLSTEILFANRIELRLSSFNPPVDSDVSIIAGDGIALTSSLSDNFQITNAGVLSANGLSGNIFVQPATQFSFGGTTSQAYLVTGSGLLTLGENNPTLFVHRGFTYRFTNIRAGHPLEILDSSDIAPAADFISSTGATRNVADQNQTVTFTIPMNASVGATFKYRCQVHPANMLGSIVVV